MDQKSCPQASPVMNQDEDKPKRVTLTKSQCESPVGQALIQLLVEVGDDGLVSSDEVRKLHAWLKENANSGLPAIRFLIEVSERILRDDIITPDECYEIQLGMERVLPKAIRQEIAKKRIAAIPPMIPETATQRQIDYIKALGGKVWPELGKWEASDLIQSLLESAPATSRQMMVLRFWNMLELESSGRRQISEWMDSFYYENPSRMDAWDLFKSESGDVGSQRDPSFVPIGIGEKYLHRVAMGDGAQTVPQKRSGCLGLLLLIFAAVFVISILIIAFFGLAS